MSSTKLGIQGMVLVGKERSVLVLKPLGTWVIKQGAGVKLSLPPIQMLSRIWELPNLWVYGVGFHFLFACFQNNLAWYCMESSSFSSCPLRTTCLGWPLPRVFTAFLRKIFAALSGAEGSGIWSREGRRK